MSYQGRILVVDDEKRWREFLQEALTAEGFQVDAIATTEEANKRIADNLYHLFVFDIRLEDSDSENVEGMELLDSLTKLGLGGAMEVIMLSAYGTREQMRESFREYDVADFIDKQQFDDREFLELVRRIFAERVRINLGLRILWQSVSGPMEVARSIKLPEGRVGENSVLQERIADELNDLLCRLFYQAKSLLVKPLVPGYSGTRVLWVQPAYETGEGQGFIVKFGDYGKIEQEYRNFNQYVQPFLGGTYTTNVIALRRTPRLGGIVYSFIGAENDRPEDFGTFYHRAKVAEIKQVLSHLFEDTCERWYANLGRLQHLDLRADYQETLGLNPVELEEIVKTKLTSVQWGNELCFRIMDENRSFQNPIQVMPVKSLAYSTYVCITHGDLNESNILIDQLGRTWLIDFRDTGEAHILRDVAKLDAVIRFELLTPEEATLAERLAMEEALANIKHFSELVQLTNNFSTANAALAKAYDISIYLRQLAHKLIGQNRHANFNEYHVASYYQALNAVRFTSLPPLQREHALLSASLLAESLGL